MSAELFAIVVSAIGIVLSLGASMFAGFSWCVRRIDSVDSRLSARIDSLETNLSARIDALETKLSARIDDVETKLSARIDALASEVTEVKIAVARLEGPPRHLYLSGR